MDKKEFSELSTVKGILDKITEINDNLMSAIKTISSLADNQVIGFCYLNTQQKITDETLAAIMSIMVMANPQEKDIFEDISKIHVAKLEKLNIMLKKRDLEGLKNSMTKGISIK